LIFSAAMRPVNRFAPVTAYVLPLVPLGGNRTLYRSQEVKKEQAQDRQIAHACPGDRRSLRLPLSA